jgi:hypothetical protein
LAVTLPRNAERIETFCHITSPGEREAEGTNAALWAKSNGRWLRRSRRSRTCLLQLVMT